MSRPENGDKKNISWVYAASVLHAALEPSFTGEKKINTFEVEDRKSTDSNLIFLLMKSSTSDLDALTILDHACKIIKHPFCTQTTRENLVSRQTSL